ncbi:hypothetical protein N7491_006062 [Penicillium cf. griseofulvum]|uniref:Zn(2)-C6 fungal-type domain-containing protein n=1 Tax=Penicillium cf. griseofulvum TaxID=2972120 RepID=A0A9W9M224_9EURO|nr:hypothetical protein N7472_010908 [Penicillium cf. griseofulvum]KAJ5429046.1 hypothetical protein N7491_006062 [Penicillium cf. griseofulvum]
MTRPRACDACAIRKVRCTGKIPCPNCTRAGFQCAFTKKCGKSGPKGPRKSTLARVSKQLWSQYDDHSEAELPASHNDNRESGISPHSASSTSEWKSVISFDDVLVYLKIYHERMYPVWPVIDIQRLKLALQNDPSDCETCALACAVCASTGASLKLDLDRDRESNFSVPRQEDAMALTDRFAAEAERYRSMYDYRESSTREAILVPLFLHLYYGTKLKKQTTSLLLRESVTMCQLMGLDNEETYSGLDSEEESFRRRTFWLLYVTERGHAMQHGTGTCLSESIKLPLTNNQSESQVLQAFNSLVHLFVSVDGVLIDTNKFTETEQRSCSKESLSRIQSELRQHPQWPTEWNEVQRSDVAITQQWLRMLVWQLSLRNVAMSSEPTADSMSFVYPAHVSRDALQSISSVSMDALVAHGPGMTRQILHEFCCYLARFDESPGSLHWLQKRIAEADVPLQPVFGLQHLPDTAYERRYSINERIGEIEDDGDEPYQV